MMFYQKGKNHHCLNRIMDTERSLYEIEVALAKSDFFNFVRNIVAFNVNGWGGELNLWHECDMLVLTKAGYLTEIEIKRSWSDFLADFKKKHKHESEGIIKKFYYAVPYSIAEKVFNYLVQNNISCDGVLYYTEDLDVRFYRLIERKNTFRKLTLSEQLQVARYGAMRSVMLREKIIKLENNDLIWTKKN